MSTGISSEKPRSAASAAAVYASAYRDVLEYLARAGAAGAFEYRGVEWLRAFRKPLMDRVYPKRLAEAWGAAPALRASEGTAPQVVPQMLRPRLPDLQFGIGPQTDILFFADPDKVRRIVAEVRPARRAAVYTNAVAPRQAWQALRRGMGFFQRSFRSSDEARYRRQAEGIFRAESTRLESGAMADELTTLIPALLPKLLFNVDKAHEFFEKYPQVRTVLLDEDATTTKNAFAQVARRHGVVSHVLCHGVLGHPNGFVPLEADVLLAWGEAQRGKLIGWGAPPDRVRVSGCSRYEQYRHLNAVSCRREAVHRYGFDAARPIGILAPPLFVPGRYAWENEMLAMVEAMFTAARRTEDVQWIVKLHAGDPREAHYRARFATPELVGRLKIETEADPYPLILASDVVLAYYSTFAVDGFAMRRPVVLMRDPFVDIYEEYRPYGVFEDVSDAAQAEQAIRRILSASMGGKAGAWADPQARHACLNEGAEPASVAVARILTASAVAGRKATA